MTEPEGRSTSLFVYMCRARGEPRRCANRSQGQMVPIAHRGCKHSFTLDIKQFRATQAVADDAGEP
ncbi:hypothetical protein HNQ60_002621 [Povalibacter uvarum]|uniref:Uncharacterized protein n=1 Tax=Povalibacter uvarum TaxID=732238 RepID=A0A841HN90_9GAMM|nr:hypothetical protein [Povalibacter uvarum]